MAIEGVKAAVEIQGARASVAPPPERPSARYSTGPPRIRRKSLAVSRTRRSFTRVVLAASGVLALLAAGCETRRTSRKLKTARTIRSGRSTTYSPARSLLGRQAFSPRRGDETEWLIGPVTRLPLLFGQPRPWAWAGCALIVCLCSLRLVPTSLLFLWRPLRERRPGDGLRGFARPTVAQDFRRGLGRFRRGLPLPCHPLTPF